MYRLLLLCSDAVHMVSCLLNSHLVKPS